MKTKEKGNTQKADEAPELFMCQAKDRFMKKNNLNLACRKVIGQPPRQHGQALVETAISALFVFIPIFICSWALYAYGQARTSALNGARYAAWERTVWHAEDKTVPNVIRNDVARRSTQEIENLMIERFFANPDAVIKSNYSDRDAAKNNNLASFYSLHNNDKVIDIEQDAGTAGDGKAGRPTLTLDEADRNTAPFVVTAFNKIADIEIFGKRLGDIAGTASLEDRGIYTATVNVKLNAVKNVKVLDELNLNITQQATVITNSWSAGGKEHEEAIVKPMVPASILDLPFMDIFKEGPVKKVVDLFTPFGEYEPGCVMGDVVPKYARVGRNNGGDQLCVN